MSNRIGYRERLLLEEMIGRNDFQAHLRTRNDGIQEIYFESTERWLTLEEMKRRYREFTYDRAIICNRPCRELASTISDLMGIHAIGGVQSPFLNQETNINIEERIKGKKLIVIGSRCRSFCDNPDMERRFDSPADNYQELRDIFQAVMLSRNKETTGIFLNPYLSCAKKDKKEGRDHLPLGATAEDLERYEAFIEEMIAPFLHARDIVNCIRKFGVEDIQMAPSYVRVIERIMVMRGLSLDGIRIVAIDDSA